MTDNNEKIVQRCKERFNQCMDVEAEQRVEMQKDLKFVRLAGEHQWDAAAVTARQMVGQERPMLTINRIAAFNNMVINEIRQNRPAIKIRPCDDNADIETAEILQGIIRNIENQSNAGIAYETAAQNMVDAGLGYWRIISQYVSDDAWEQELIIQRIPDIFKVYFDPNSTEPDGSDARWCAIVEEIPRDSFEQQYPKESAGWDIEGEGDSEWINKKVVRVCEYFEIKETPENIALLADGSTAWESELTGAEQVINTRKSTRKTVSWYKIGANVILDSTEIPVKWIPVIPVIGNEVWVDGKRHIFGLTRHGRAPQQLYNFWASAEAENLALVPLAPYIGDPASFSGYEDKWSQSNKRPFAYLPFNAYDEQNRALPRPERQAFVGAPQGLIAAKQSAIDDIKSSLGIYDAALGANPNSQSGKAVLSLQNQASQGTFHYSSNMARSIQHTGRILVDWIPKVYDTERVMRIIGEDDEIDHVKINPELPQPKAEIEDERGEIQKIYNISIGRYDVYADVGASYATKRQESANSMLEMVRSFPQLMQVAGDLIVKNLDWAGADSIAERLKKALPPPLQEQEDDQQSPELQQATQQMNQMADQMQEMGAEIQRLTDERELKERELQIKQFDAETKRLQALATLEKDTPAGIEPTTMELEKHASQMLNEEHARELAIMQEIHRQNMDMKNLKQPEQQEQPQAEAAEPVQEPPQIEQQEPI